MTHIAMTEASAESELDLCLDLIRSAFATVAEERGFTEATVPDHTAYTSRLDLEQLQARGARFFLARVDDQPAGCVVLAPGRRADRPTLQKLAVLPAHRQGGIGRTLVQRVIAEARLAGAESLGIAIIDDDTRLKAWCGARASSRSGRPTTRTCRSPSATSPVRCEPKRRGDCRVAH